MVVDWHEWPLLDFYKTNINIPWDSGTLLHKMAPFISLRDFYEWQEVWGINSLIPSFIWVATIWHSSLHWWHTQNQWSVDRRGNMCGRQQSTNKTNKALVIREPSHLSTVVAVQNDPVKHSVWSAKARSMCVCLAASPGFLSLPRPHTSRQEQCHWARSDPWASL